MVYVARFQLNLDNPVFSKTIIDPMFVRLFKILSRSIALIALADKLSPQKFPNIAAQRIHSAKLLHEIIRRKHLFARPSRLIVISRNLPPFPGISISIWKVAADETSAKDTPQPPVSRRLFSRKPSAERLVVR